MVDSSGADVRACGALGGRTRRFIDLLMAACVVVNDFDALVDELKKIPGRQTDDISKCLDAKELLKTHYIVAGFDKVKGFV